MTLQEKLADFKAQFESGGPPYNTPKALIEIFHRTTEELRRSGLAERALKTGHRAPAFTLKTHPVASIARTRRTPSRPAKPNSLARWHCKSWSTMLATSARSRS